MANQDGTAEPLGRVKLVSETGETILIPKPSNDPNDPLNWSKAFKYYVAVLTCFGMLMTTFLAAGPAVAIVQIAMDFGSGPSTNLAVAIPQVSFFFTSSALVQGVGNLLWMPLIQIYGARPIYIISFTAYLITAVWSGIATSFGSELVARLLLGFFSGAGECLGPRTISDIFFLHQRASVMALYNFAVATGIPIGIVVSGAITLKYSWRVIYLVGSVLLGALVILIIFTLPETSFNRKDVDDVQDVENDNPTKEDQLFGREDNPYRLSLSIVLNDQEKARVAEYYQETDMMQELGISNESQVIQRMEARIRRLEMTMWSQPRYDQLGPSFLRKKSYWSTLRLFSGEKYTKESFWTMFVRPFGLIFLPPVTWATFAMAVLIGLNVAISSVFANDFGSTYQFSTFESGLCFLGALVGGILAIPAGGPVSEAVANFFTRRNRGFREPEFRLPAMVIALLTAPAGLFLYGFGIQQKLHFMVPVLGLSLLSFATSQSINVSLVYTLDAYAPISGEVTITQLVFKSLIGFGISSGTNIWIQKAGHLVAFSEMAIMAFVVLALAAPLFFYGASLRSRSLNWKVVRFVKW